MSEFNDFFKESKSFDELSKLVSVHRKSMEAADDLIAFQKTTIENLQKKTSNQSVDKKGKEIALEAALRISSGQTTGDELVDIAEQIYNWLIKE